MHHPPDGLAKRSETCCRKVAITDTAGNLGERVQMFRARHGIPHTSGVGVCSRGKIRHICRVVNTENDKYVVWLQQPSEEAVTKKGTSTM
jgi:hypothetical protein